MHPFNYVAYYRDYQIKNNTYTNLNEAIVRVLDSGFETDDQIDTKLTALLTKSSPHAFYGRFTNLTGETEL